MPPLDADPVVIDPIDPAGGWAGFRVGDHRQRLALMRELRNADADVALKLG